MFLVGPPKIEPMKEGRQVQVLIKALGYRGVWYMIRKAAAEALGKVGDPGAVEPLITTLSDKDKDVRKSVAWGLVSLSHAAQLDDEIKQRILSVLS
jgi:HEAT repeat protein